MGAYFGILKRIGFQNIWNHTDHTLIPARRRLHGAYAAAQAMVARPARVAWVAREQLVLADADGGAAVLLVEVGAAAVAVVPPVEDVVHHLAARRRRAAETPPQQRSRVLSAAISTRCAARVQRCRSCADGRWVAV